nr:redoxin domain-containing protein [Planctomycetota bacterium]
MRQALLLLILLATAALGADEARTAKATELVKVMQTKEHFAKGVADDMNAGMGPALKEMPAEQRESFAAAMVEVSAIISERVAWADVESQYVALYAEQFTVEELDALIAFYRTPVGTALATRAPVIAQTLSTIKMEQLQKLMPEIQKVMMAAMSKGKQQDKLAKAEKAGLVIGKPFPALELPTTDGGTISTAALSGKVVLIDFWATWCGPCVRELPHVKKAYEQYHDQGFEIIGVSLDEDTDKLSAFVKEQAIPWKQHCDGQGWQGPLPKRFAVTSIPATFLVGRDGTLVK